jgi:hypothetical protein
MRLEMDNQMNLINMYISEIGHRLPQKTRSDIEAEIRSVIQDMLDERLQGSGQPISDELILEVLKEYGSPEKVAASYQGERYLVGPRLYPTFEKVLFIVLPITVILALVGLGISLSISGTTARDVIALISQTFGSMIGSVISTIGILVLIFAILERTVPEFRLKTKDAKEWDPGSLRKISQSDRVKSVELMVEIFSAGLGILIFNFFPQVIAYTPSLNNTFETGDWQTVSFIPLLSDAFLRYIPYLTAIWVMIIVLNAVLIQRGHWETWSRWCAVGIKAAGIGIAIFMLTGPSLIANNIFLPLSEGTDILMNLLTQIIRVGLALSILFGGLDLIKMLLRLIRTKNLAGK